MLCPSPQPLLPVFITGSPVIGARDWLLCLALGTWLVQGPVQNQGDCLTAPSGPHSVSGALTVLWGPEPQCFRTFCELLAAPLAQCARKTAFPFLTSFSISESNPIQRNEQGMDPTPFHHLSFLSHHWPPTQTPPFSPFRSRLSTAGDEVGVLCIPTTLNPHQPQPTSSILSLANQGWPGCRCLIRGREWKGVGGEGSCWWRAAHHPLQAPSVRSQRCP